MVLAAINTVVAGLLALMHNSGLPDRYRMNKVQFAIVEDFLKVSAPPILYMRLQVGMPKLEPGAS